MSTEPSRHGTSDPAINERLVALLDELGTENNRDQIYEMLAVVADLAQDDAERLDLKIMNAALHEMRMAFKTFKPYSDRPKVTIFGSARTLPTDPLYEYTKKTAHLLAEQGWMVVTGAGPGIMAAGLEGAGPENSFGINIRLPFEQSANEFIATDPKLVTMKYFFTRKLMLIKESDGFVVLPGGFGTLDESFELLTLVQTGKAEPQPIVLLEVPGGTYWQEWMRFVEEVKVRGLISPSGDVLFKITDSAEEAAEEIIGFWRNYHSRRFVGQRLVIRLQSAPTQDELAQLSEEFADICVGGVIESTEPLPAEVHDNDELDMARIVFKFDRMHQARLRELINRLNQLPSAPAGQPAARHYTESSG
jgi:uncharacterized protein (TIGR00730 family)